jgi:hypothetical protein
LRHSVVVKRCEVTPLTSPEGASKVDPQLDEKFSLDNSTIAELKAEHFAFKWTPDGFECPSCPFKTKIGGCLLNHIEKKHPELRINRERIMKCAHCPYQSEYRLHFAQHVLKKHTDPHKKQTRK